MRQGLGVWEGRISEMNLIPKTRAPGEVNRVRQSTVVEVYRGLLTSYPLCSVPLVVTKAHTAVRVTGSLCDLWKRPL